MAFRTAAHSRTLRCLPSTVPHLPSERMALLAAGEVEAPHRSRRADLLALLAC